jgi:hypothetical protein
VSRTCPRRLDSTSHTHSHRETSQSECELDMLGIHQDHIRVIPGGGEFHRPPAPTSRSLSPLDRLRTVMVLDKTCLWCPKLDIGLRYGRPACLSWILKNNAPFPSLVYRHRSLHLPAGRCALVVLVRLTDTYMYTHRHPLTYVLSALQCTAADLERDFARAAPIVHATNSILMGVTTER